MSVATVYHIKRPAADRHSPVEKVHWTLTFTPLEDGETALAERSIQFLAYALNPCGGFEKAAIVREGAFVHTSEILEDIFTRTNTIEFPWWENEGVRCVCNNGEGGRSMSVGDVVVLSNGDTWFCSSYGFKKMPRYVSAAFKAVGTLIQEDN